jgi:hypothetical protein
MTFHEWLEEHKDELVQLLRNDTEEALYQAWIAGADSIADYLGKTLKD